MAIQATFTADTKPLEAGLERAAAKIAGTKRASEDAGRALKAMGSSFDGTRTEGAALRLVNSVQKVGGAVRLTDGEWKKADRTLTEVLQKYERMNTVAPAAVQALRRELDAVRTSATQANAALGGVAGSAGGFGAILSGFGLGVGAGLGMGALGAISATVKDLASDAARLTPLAQSFERLQGGAANAETSLLALRVATKGLISDADLLQAANKGSLLGLDAMGIQFDEVARTATILGRAMGQDAAKSVEDLTTALARMSPEILDNLGLKVSLSAATESYARALGKTADALTDEERKRAFATAAMEAAREKVAQLGDVTLTAAEQWQRLTTAATDAGTRLLAAGNQSSALSSILDEFVVTLTTATTGVSEFSTAWQALDGDLARYMGAARDSAVATDILGAALQATVAPGIKAVSLAIEGATRTMERYRDVLRFVQGDSEVTSLPTGRGDRVLADRSLGANARANEWLRQEEARLRADYLKSQEDGLRKIEQGADKATRALRTMKREADKPLAPQSFLQAVGATLGLGSVTSASATAARLAAFRGPMSALGTFGATGIAGALTPDLAAGLNIPGASSPFSTVGGLQPSISGQNIAGQIRTVSTATRDWRTEVRGVAQAFGTLAQIAGPSLDNASRGIGTVLAASDAAFQTISLLSEQFSSLSNGEGGLSRGGRAAAGGLAGVTTGLQLGSLFSNRAAGFVAGGIGGAVSGGMAGGGTGALAGGILGAASGLFAANQNRKAQAAQIEQMRQQTIASFGTISQFQVAVERAGYSFDYFLQSFNSNNPQTFTTAINSLNTALAEQDARSAKLSQSLQNVARVQGVLTQQQIAQIRTLRAGDPAGASITEFAEGQRAQAERGLLAVVAALDSYGDTALQDFEGAARGAASGLAALFGESLAAGESAIDIIGRLGGAMNTLADLFSKSGITPGAGFAQIQDLASILANPQTAGAVQTAQGLGQALAGFYNTGVFAAFPELFADIANGIGSAWKALENFGAGGQRGAALLQPYLQNLWEIIDANPELRDQLDEQTRALLEFAEANGLVGPQFRDAAEKMQDALQRLIDKLDEFIERMGTAAGLTFPAPGTPTAPTGPASPSAPPPPSSPGPNGGDYTTPGFAGGSNGVRDFGRESLVRLHGREVVQTEGQYEAMKAQGRISVRSNASAMAGVQQVITVQLGRETIARAVAEDLPRLVQVYGGAA